MRPSSRHRFAHLIAKLSKSSEDCASSCGSGELCHLTVDDSLRPGDEIIGTVKFRRSKHGSDLRLHCVRFRRPKGPKSHLNFTQLLYPKFIHTVASGSLRKI